MPTKFILWLTVHFLIRFSEQHSVIHFKKVRRLHFNSTNMDCIALKYSFSNIANIGLHFCNFVVHKSFNIFYSLDHGLIDDVD